MRISRPLPIVFFFFFNDTATTEIYTLSLHDALPISRAAPAEITRGLERLAGRVVHAVHREVEVVPRIGEVRSEEHTSELQSQSNLVCRLLLEKKKETMQTSRWSLDTRPERWQSLSCA